MEVQVKAHMPGMVARVVVNEGDKVEKGEEVVVLNCMKMEMAVESEYDAVVKEVLVKEWDEVQVDTPMIILEVESE